MALIQRGNYYYAGWLKWRQMENTSLCVCVRVGLVSRFQTHIGVTPQPIISFIWENIANIWEKMTLKMSRTAEHDFSFRPRFWSDLNIKLQSVKSKWAMCMGNVCKKITYLQISVGITNQDLVILKSSSFRVIWDTCFGFDSESQNCEIKTLNWGVNSKFCGGKNVYIRESWVYISHIFWWKKNSKAINYMVYL